MTAVRMWARAELRARWKAWALLGLLAGATFGLSAAAVAGARRSSDAVPALAAAIRVPTAALLPNDPTFDEEKRAAVAALPEVTRTYPFLVAFGAEVVQPRGLDTTLLADDRATGVASSPRRSSRGVRLIPDAPTRWRSTRSHATGTTSASARRWSSRQTAESLAPFPPELVPEGDADVPATSARRRHHEVGVERGRLDAVERAVREVPAASWPGFVNMFVDLRHGEADLARFRADVERIIGHPVNVESSADLFGIRKANNVTDVESDGLLLFALAALLGGGVLVGQALVRTVTAGAADLPTWRAIGADRGIAIRAMVAPSIVTAAVGAVTTVVVAIALSSRFPIGVARQYDLDLGTHADWLVLGVAVVAIVLAVGAVAALAAWWRVTRRERGVRGAVDRRAMGCAAGVVAGARDRVAARGGAGAWTARGARALRAHRRDRRRARRGRVLHVPRRDRGRAHHTRAFGRRVGLRHRVR